ncbi:c-type cytochrome domain-containing protein [Pareuzebyella sediminis]|uniref:c-type cytochrome domain-containing protein n=1 Tax=Pareuzebyella sediminis TaxID=2607998 RepID=UPI0011EBB41B|nr:c-type cytochrome domain-containing protein [Pareuzebyella sediminis]
MDVLKQLMGRLHPLVVHLPIGFIILGLLLQWYDRKTKHHNAVISLIYLWAGTFAILACITGYLQYMGEGYSFDTVKWHLWAGIATAIFSFVMYSKVKGTKAFAPISKIPMGILSFIFLFLISFTGHLGGNITHGEDYLIEPLPNSVRSALGFDTYEDKEIALNEDNWSESLIYEDVVAPILNNRCVSCHNPKKNKGELLLDSAEGMLKGGESGETLLAENAEKSELFKRMNLPVSDEDHMPPEEKTQPSKEELLLIGAWLDAGHPFKGTIGEAGMAKELFEPFFPKKHDFDYPDIEVAEAHIDSINVIKKNNIHVDRISKATNFLTVSCINDPSFTDADFELLQPIAQQIAVLDLGGTQVTDAIFEKLAILPHLTVLKIDNTQVTGTNIGLLAPSNYLKLINLTATKFQKVHLNALEQFKALKKVYLYRTGIDASGVKTLNNGQIIIDYGDYQLPPIPADTIIY